MEASVKARIDQIREKRHAATLPKNQCGMLPTASWVDIDFLLSLVKSQEAVPNWNINPDAKLLDNWPMRDVLVALTHAATHLLTDHDCDTHGYEELQHAVVAARCYADLLDNSAAAAAIQEENNSLRAELSSSAEAIVNEAGKVSQLISNFCTSMRSACVEKVKSLAVAHRALAGGLTDGIMAELQRIRADECDAVASALESLSIEKSKE